MNSRELEGQTEESMKRYESVLQTTRAKGLPDTHIMIKMATVLPRVMPTQAELTRFRKVRCRLGVWKLAADTTILTQSYSSLSFTAIRG